MATAELLATTVPECLRQRAQWVCWKSVVRDGKPTKVPFDPRTGREASSTNPATWSDFDTALAACEAGNGYSGIGFVFTPDDPFCGIDLDDCIDAATGELKRWARELIDQLGSYAEISPSGTGVKVFVRAGKPGKRCRRAHGDGEVEIYDQGRYFTVTGRHLAGTPADVMDRQTELEDVYQRVLVGDEAPQSSPEPRVTNAAGPPALSDEQILDKMGRAKNVAKFKALWRGDWAGKFPSQSEADASLMFSLAFYTRDAQQLDRLFRQSGLIRSKWDEKHGASTYGQRTIEGALSKVTGQYQPRQYAAAPKALATGGDGEDPQPADDDRVPLGQPDPQTGRLVLSPTKTLPTAEAFMAGFYQHPEGPTLYAHAGAFLAWQGNRYAEVEDQALRHRLQPWLHRALRYAFNPGTKAMELVDFDSNPSTVNAALECIRAHAHLPARVTPTCWLTDDSGQQDPRELLPCLSRTLHVPSGRMLPPTPVLFNINALDFDYDPNAPEPERWIKLMEQLWGDDLESVELLQEFMGYCLVGDTSQQKMLLLVGPKRSGKGTIGRVLARLVGAANVVGPTTSSLAGAFGLQPLIGKSLAIVSDARFSGENISVVVERLLCISGEDTLTVDRKFLGSVTMKLPTRFMFLTNELPRMNDASGALAGRFLILRLTRSFYGHEDVTLTRQLMEELPGILLWAIEGLKRLRQRGHFVQPKSVADAVQDLEDLASPVMAFVRDACEVAPGNRAWVDDLYNAWKAWCEADGRMVVTHKQTFGRDLAAAVPGVVCRKNSIKGRFYEGIGLRAGGVA